MPDQLVHAALEGREIDDCRLLRRISSGGIGAVYLAQQHRLGDRLVAVKVIPLDTTTLGTKHEPISSIEQRFVREGKLLGHLSHPHILPIHDAGTDGNLLYLVMQYAPDGSLMDALRGRGPHPLQLPLSLPLTLDLLSQVASALQFIHEHGIVHRDVKPSNILVHVESERHWHVLLADFGIARAADSTAQQHVLAGTLAYMAPEQFRGYYSPASDQYALAVVAYLLLTGHLPFEGNAATQVHGHLHGTPAPLRAFNPAIPVGVEQVVLRALSKQPAARYPSVAAFMDALAVGAASDQTTTAHQGFPAPFAVAPGTPPLRAAGTTVPLALGLANRTREPGMSTTEAAAPARYSGSEGARGGTDKQRGTARRRRAAILLACLALLLIALAADLAYHHVGQTANGANQPPFHSLSGATAVAATATATTGSPDIGSSTPVAPTAGAGQAPPAIVPPGATAGAATPPAFSPPANAAQVITQPSPATATAGQHYTVTATFLNSGTATWRSGYGLLCDKSHYPQSSCAAGSTLPFSGYSVAPDQRVTFSISLVAPTTPGSYTSWWTLEQNGQAFGAQDVQMRVSVTPSTTPSAGTPSPSSSPSPPPSPSPTFPAGSSATTGSS